MILIVFPLSTPQTENDDDEISSPTFSVGKLDEDLKENRLRESRHQSLSATV
jgi:hypothetical protein